MTITATPRVVRLPTICSILVASLGLSVEAGLLKNKTLGLSVRVWVTSMCRRRLFESLYGIPPLPFASFTRVTSLRVWVLVRLCGCPSI